VSDGERTVADRPLAPPSHILRPVADARPIAPSPAADPVRAGRFPFVPGAGAPPIPIARTEGCWLVLADGRRLLDAAGGALVTNVGHGRAEVVEAVARTLARTDYVVPPFATDERVRLVERLVDRWLPAGLTRVALTSGGSESVDAALRLARQHHVAAGRPGRWKVIGRELSYHGTTLGTLAAGGHARRRAGLAPLLLDWPKAPACDCLRCPLGLSLPGCGIACADAVERAIEREGPETVAAVIAEPIVGSTAGALVPPDDYWPRLAAICRRHGVLLIADEVMTGFGRTGRRFAVQHWNVTPDILVGGKGLAGGYAPMGGVFAREEVIAPLAARGEEFMFYTFGAHPAACAAAEAVLELLERERLVERAATVGAALLARLREGLGGHPHVAEVRGRGLMIGIELVRDRTTLEPFAASAGFTGKVVGCGLRRGVFVYPASPGPGRDAILLGPPFTIADAELDLLVETLPAAIDDAARLAAAS
jgi:adenosylmethionine-8-amino-7-oxononanoate aminotransferase